MKRLIAIATFSLAVCGALATMGGSTASAVTGDKAAIQAAVEKPGRRSKLRTTTPLVIEPPDTDAMTPTSPFRPASARYNGRPAAHTDARCPPPDKATPTRVTVPPPPPFSVVIPGTPSTPLARSAHSRIFRRLIQCVGDVLQLIRCIAPGEVAQHELTRPGAVAGGDIVSAAASAHPSSSAAHPGSPRRPRAAGWRVRIVQVRARSRSGSPAAALAPVRYSGHLPASAGQDVERVQVQMHYARLPDGCRDGGARHGPQPGGSAHVREQGMHGTAGLACGAGLAGAAPGEVSRPAFRGASPGARRSCHRPRPGPGRRAPAAPRQPPTTRPARRR